jgi:hypothetical protein
MAFVLAILFLGLWGVLFFPLIIAIAYIWTKKQCPICGHKFNQY